jgi:ribosome biogenesis GTPase
MENLGLSQRFINEATMYKDLFIGRVMSQYKNLYKVYTENGEVLAEVSGKFRFNAVKVSDYPAVGDFVMMDRMENSGGNAIIHQVLTRKSAFIRKAPGTANEDQVIAANIDTVFICMSLNNNFNLHRIERYLSVAWDSGASPVIILTKSDLCDNIEEKLTEIEKVALGVDVVVTTSMSEDGYLPIQKYIGRNKTIAFIGSSGVGKSTLINKLIGEDSIATNGLRDDDKGRHTTTRRETYILPDGGIVIDTPGMREMAVEGGDLERTFVDIEELTTSCKFSDCTHSGEPGCAVQEAIENGTLSADRLESYIKLKKEANYDGLTSRQISNIKLDRMSKEFGSVKNMRDFVKSKSKRK